MKGILDVLVCEWGSGEGGDGGGIAAFRQTLSEDHTFLKVVGMLPNIRYNYQISRLKNVWKSVP